MVRLHAELGASGLEILAFPCNQFGNQEPQAARDVETRIRKRYGVAFHVMAKVDVNGPNSHAVFRYLKHKTPKVPRISWNSASTTSSGGTATRAPSRTRRPHSSPTPSAPSSRSGPGCRS